MTGSASGPPEVSGGPEDVLPQCVDREAGLAYVFGAFLIATGVKMLAMKAGDMDPNKNVLVRVVDAARAGALLATPLLLALIIVEFTDVIFAVDSIPAIFAITADPFLVFTSNVFAILGLRSLYFALAGMIGRFRYLKVSLSIVLMVVGVTMMTHGWLKQLLGQHFNLYLLAVVLGIPLAEVLASPLTARRPGPEAGASR